MKQKSITFRCSAAQFHRLQENIRARESATRTHVISGAIEEFLDFVEKPEQHSLDLFELVRCIDEAGEGPPFAEQA